MKFLSKLVFLCKCAAERLCFRIEKKLMLRGKNITSELFISNLLQKMFLKSLPHISWFEESFKELIKKTYLFSKWKLTTLVTQRCCLSAEGAKSARTFCIPTYTFFSSYTSSSKYKMWHFLHKQVYFKYNKILATLNEEVLISTTGWHLSWVYYWNNSK